jgi:hypothetical protein
LDLLDQISPNLIVIVCGLLLANGHCIISPRP